MHFKSIAASVALLLSATVLAAPVSDAPSDVVQFFARGITVSVAPDHTGDYSRLAQGRPPNAAKPPPGCKKQDMRNWKKAENRCKSWDDLHAEFRDIVSPRVDAAIKAAEHKLHLNGHIEAHVKSAFHHNAAHDDLFHWTFTFSAPSCEGECTGHAYESGAPRQARVWNAHHALVFP